MALKAGRVGVDPVIKTDSMTAEVGIDPKTGKLYHVPGSADPQVDERLDALEETVESLEGDVDDLEETVSAQSTAITQLTDALTHTAEGNPCVVDDAVEANAEDVTVAFEPIQSGSGDPSPDNVRAINGWTDINLSQSGKNMYSVTVDNDTWSLNASATCSGADGVLTVEATASNYSGVFSGTSAKITKLIAKLNGVFTYSFDVKASASATLLCGISTLGQTTVSATTSWQRVSITATFANASKTFALYNYSGSAVTIYLRNMMVEAGSSASDYEAYDGEDYTISFGNTYYGGTVDFTTGVLTKEWENITSYAGETINEPWLSSMDVYSEGATPTTGAQVVYKLATPTTTQLTAQEIALLKGANVITADGTVTLKYVASTASTVNEAELTSVVAQIAPIEDGDTASQPYTTGKYFWHYGAFCKAKTDIASGATFTLNTNYEVTTVADALYSALNS